MQGGIWFLKALATLEVIYYDLTNVQLPTDPNEAQFLRPTGQQFVCSTSSLYPNWLAAMTWRDKEAPAVNQVAQHLQEYENQKNRSCSPIYIYGPVPQLLTVSLDPLDQEEGCRKYTQQATLQFYLWDHWHEEVGLKWVTSISSLLEDSQYERFRCNQVKLEEQNNINQLSCSSYQCSVVSKCKITLLSTFL